MLVVIWNGQNLGASGCFKDLINCFAQILQEKNAIIYNIIIFSIKKHIVSNPYFKENF